MKIKREDFRFTENVSPEFGLYSIQAWTTLSGKIDINETLLHERKTTPLEVIALCKESLWERINYELFYPVVNKLQKMLSQPDYFKREAMIKELIKELT